MPAALSAPMTARQRSDAVANCMETASSNASTKPAARLRNAFMDRILRRFDVRAPRSHLECIFPSVSRRLRLFAVIFTALSLLGSEAALPSRPCPQSSRMPMPQRASSSSPCDWHRGAVCLEDCKKRSAEADLKRPARGPLQPAPRSWLRVALSDDPFTRGAIARRSTPPPPQPPPFIRFAALRI